MVSSTGMGGVGGVFFFVIGFLQSEWFRFGPRPQGHEDWQRAVDVSSEASRLGTTRSSTVILSWCRCQSLPGRIVCIIPIEVAQRIEPHVTQPGKIDVEIASEAIDEAGAGSSVPAIVRGVIYASYLQLPPTGLALLRTLMIIRNGFVTRHEFDPSISW